MKKILQKIIGNINYIRLESFKKRFWPTPFDRQQEQFIKKQVQFYSVLVKPNDLCFDIGANIGIKTDVFLRLGAKVIALEPQQNCVDILTAKYGNKAVILQKGAGAVNEVKDFYVSNESALSSFNKNWLEEFSDERFRGAAVAAIQKTEIITLDSLIEKYGSPGFIKIDVEGYEIQVLQGLNKPFGCLSFEYVVPEHIDKIVFILDLLQKKYPGLVCNFAVNNDSSFALQEWIPIGSMLPCVKSPYFNSTYAGDIYVKNEQ